jgi:hypothetical protein
MGAVGLENNNNIICAACCDTRTCAPSRMTLNVRSSRCPADTDFSYASLNAVKAASYSTYAKKDIISCIHV